VININFIVAIAGTVHSVGNGVTRFKPGDHVLAVCALRLLQDARYAGLQRYTLVYQDLTSKIGSADPTTAIAAASLYQALAALTIHLSLSPPTTTPDPTNLSKRVLIWGGSSTVGSYAIQLASKAGYTVVTTSSPQYHSQLLSFGATETHDRHDTSLKEKLTKAGPYEAVLAAADSAEDQTLMASVLAAQGGGSILSTMGARPGAVVPPGVEVKFGQFIDSYLGDDAATKERREKFFWGFLENDVLGEGRLGIQLVDTTVVGGLGKAEEGLERLRGGHGAGRLVIRNDID
jgi:NADPH:quinone reductase-like Zn-dependent oxidoreductase